jgi:hypothetical protein
LGHQLSEYGAEGRMSRHHEGVFLMNVDRALVQGVQAIVRRTGEVVVNPNHGVSYLPEISKVRQRRRT